jgi:hypothetical protein
MLGRADVFTPAGAAGELAIEVGAGVVDVVSPARAGDGQYLGQVAMVGTPAVEAALGVKVADVGAA